MKPVLASIPAVAALAVAFAGPAAAQAPAAPPAAVQPPSPEQAQVLEKQIDAWLAANLAGIAKLAPRPVQLTAEGDHYLMKVPVGSSSVQPADAAFTAKLRPLGGTRWALDDQQIPPDLTIKATERVPDPPDAKNPSPDGMHSETVTYHVKLGKQDVSGVVDTSFATATTSGGTIASLDLEKEGGSGATLTHTGPITSQNSSRPIDGAHSDLQGTMTAQGYAAKTAMPDGTEIQLSADRVRMVSALSGLAHDQLLPLLHMAVDLSKLPAAKTADGDDSTPSMTPAERAKLHEILQRAHGVLTGGQVEEALEGVKFDFSGSSGSLKAATLTMAGQAPADLLTASLGFVLDGLVVDSLPPPFAAYVPTHFEIHPMLSNVSVSALTKMGLDATEPDGKAPADPDFAPLFAKGGITFGFDRMAMDVAGTQFTGNGSFTATQPDPAAITGQAQVTARGLDGLLAKLQAEPMAQSAVPVLIFLKGIARTAGDQSVWQISLAGGKALVNGVDLSALAGMGSK